MLSDAFKNQLFVGPAATNTKQFTQTKAGLSATPMQSSATFASGAARVTETQMSAANNGMKMIYNAP